MLQWTFLRERQVYMKKPILSLGCVTSTMYILLGEQIIAKAFVKLQDTHYAIDIQK